MSDGEWDADDFEPAAPAVAVTDKWEGEDDDDVKDSWDAEDEDKEKSATDDGTVKAVQRKKKKPLAERIAEKEAARLSAAQKEKEENKVLTKDEKMAEAERLKKVQEEADLKLAKEAFGVVDTEATGIDAMSPNTEEEFIQFKDVLKQKISSYKGSTFYGGFLDKLIQDLLIDCNLDDLKKISTNAGSIFHEKTRQQKELEKKKKKKTKGIVKAERDTDFGDLAAAGRGDYDDYNYEEDFI